MRKVEDIQLDIDQTEYQRDYLNERLSRLHIEMQDALAQENLPDLTNAVSVEGYAFTLGSKMSGDVWTKDTLEKMAQSYRAEPNVISAVVDDFGLWVVRRP